MFGLSVTHTFIGFGCNGMELEGNVGTICNRYTTVKTDVLKYNQVGNQVLFRCRVEHSCFIKVAAMLLLVKCYDNKMVKLPVFLFRNASMQLSNNNKKKEV